jgi:hypothetical protein
MYIDFSGKELAVDLEEESTFMSRHTGKELKRVRLGLIAHTPRAHGKLLVSIKHAEREGIDSTDGSGKVTGSWKIADSSFFLLGNESSPEYYHVIEIEEAEEIKVDELMLNDLVLSPYFYEEEFDCDDLSVKARVRVTPEQDLQLRELIKASDYISVVRGGLCDQPREMRFSRTILWSKHRDDIKYELILVDRSYDERDRPLSRLFQPQMSRMQETVAIQAEMIEGMIAILQGKGLIKAEEIEQMRSKAADRASDRAREFFRVEDIDEFSRPQPRITWD